MARAVARNAGLGNTLRPSSLATARDLALRGAPRATQPTAYIELILL